MAKQVSVIKRFSFWPILFIGLACAVLLILTIMSRRGVRVNTFMAMAAVSVMFGMTMVAFAVELEKALTWKDIWRPFVIGVALVVVCVVGGWLIELGKPDLVAE